MESEPNFMSYTRRELLEIYEKIDRNAYPERFEKVEVLLGLSDNSDALEDLNVDPEQAAIHKARRIEEFFESLDGNTGGYSSSGSFGDSGAGTGDTGGD